MPPKGHTYNSKTITSNTTHNPIDTQNLHQRGGDNSTEGEEQKKTGNLHQREGDNSTKGEKHKIKKNINKTTGFASLNYWSSLFRPQSQRIYTHPWGRVEGDERNQLEANLIGAESKAERIEERKTGATSAKPRHQTRKYRRLCTALEQHRWRWGERMDGWRGKMAREAKILQGRVERRDGVDKRKEGSGEGGGGGERWRPPPNKTLVGAERLERDALKH